MTQQTQQVIACDVDNVLADLYVEWLRRYNLDYNDSLKPEGIHQWDITQAVKQECGHKIFDYLMHPDLYDLVPLVEFAQEGVAQLREWGYRVVFVTSCTKNMADQKWEWLERFGFLEPTKMQHADLILAHDKSLINADLLIDDHVGNFKDWTRPGILLTTPPNKAAVMKPNVKRAMNWPDIVLMIHDHHLYQSME